ncbi:EAL domain-containing protein [Pantoea sp. 1.19]|uniref:EAL domain-containing protein n=1 Tax=Pantoea sp. 1.19 TaxID=1925589 RepID=UPI0009491B59|nr:EAL domain-containing protein [Pantoea sp. 1.19]
MNNHLEADSLSQAIYSPMYRFNGELAAVTVTTPFQHASANVLLPQEMHNAQLTLAQRERLLLAQLQDIEKHRAFFTQHRVEAGIAIDAVVADALLTHPPLRETLERLPFVALLIREDFPHLAQGLRDPLLRQLSEAFMLCLENAGAGKAPPTAIYDGMFHRVRLDKRFVQQMMKRGAFRPFMQTLRDNFAPFCDELVIQGIDNVTMLEKVRHLGYHAVSGDLFANATPDTLSALTRCPDVFS